MFFFLLKITNYFIVEPIHRFGLHLYNFDTDQRKRDRERDTESGIYLVCSSTHRRCCYFFIEAKRSSPK